MGPILVNSTCFGRIGTIHQDGILLSLRTVGNMWDTCGKIDQIVGYVWDNLDPAVKTQHDFDIPFPGANISAANHQNVVSERRMSEHVLAAKIIEIIPYLYRSLVAVAQKELDDRLTMQQLRVLGYLHRQPGSSLGDLARWRDVSLPTMSKMIQCLVNRELVTRVPDPDNRRAIRITLTPAGEELYGTILAGLQQRLTPLLSDIKPDEQESVLETLERLSDVFADVGEVRQHLQLIDNAGLPS